MNDPVIGKELQEHYEDLNYGSTHGDLPPTPGQGEQDLVMDQEVDNIQFEDEGQIDKDVDVDEILLENEGQEVITIGGDDDDIEDEPKEIKSRKKYDKGQKHIMDL